MMSVTHATIAASIGVLALQSSDSYVIALLIAGSQIPDIDNTQSYVGRAVWPLARFIEERWPHRTVTHCLWFCLVIAAVSFSLCQYLNCPQYWLATPLGHLIAICTDTLTPEGVQLFWPSPYWAVCGSNPNARIRTGSKAEIGLIAVFAALLAFTLWNSNSEGLNLKLLFNQLMGFREAVTETINEQGNNKHIYVDINGVFNADRSIVKKRFWVLEQIDKEFILVDDKGIYKTGITGQISPSKLVPQLGENAKIQVIGIDFNEEEITPKLNTLAAANPESLIFLTGILTVDSAEDIQVSASPKQFQTMQIAGNQVKLESCPISWVINQLNYQFGSGNLKAKIVFPVPKLGGENEK